MSFEQEGLKRPSLTAQVLYWRPLDDSTTYDCFWCSLGPVSRSCGERLITRLVEESPLQMTDKPWQTWSCLIMNISMDNIGKHRTNHPTILGIQVNLLDTRFDSPTRAWKCSNEGPSPSPSFLPNGEEAEPKGRDGKKAVDFLNYISKKSWEGGFKYLLFLPLLGEMIRFDEYVSMGLKPPTRYRENEVIESNMIDSESWFSWRLSKGITFSGVVGCSAGWLR